MKAGKRQERHAQIAESAYAVLRENGYSGASLLTIAKAANASNETLYRWYGGKIGLFETLVKDNAADAKQTLETAISRQANPVETLETIAPLLLRMVLGEKAILLNKAAAADPSGDLGRAIAEHGRNVIAPLIGQAIAAFTDATGHNPSEVAETFVALLIGDLQIRRVIGAMPEPSDEFVERRAKTAIDQIMRLYG